MKLAEETEIEKKREEIIDAWKESVGYKEPVTQDDPAKMSIPGIIKTILIKPYFWIFAAILSFSPHCAEILNVINNLIAK